jgi:CheY-like chemotaxis protein
MNNQPKSKILVVDDAVENIKLVTEILNRPKSEYQIEAAGDGYEALEMVKTFKPELIMLDVVMPGIDGFPDTYCHDNCPG